MLLRDFFCRVLVRATRCCVTVFACTSGRGNLLLWYTIMEDIRQMVLQDIVYEE